MENFKRKAVEIISLSQEFLTLILDDKEFRNDVMEDMLEETYWRLRKETLRFRG